MSLNETLVEKFLRLRKTAEAAETGKVAAALPLKKRKSSEMSTSAAADNADQKEQDAKGGDDFQALVKRYKEAMEQRERDKNAKQQEFEQQFKGKMNDLRAAYLYGLKQVSALKDLQDAPDAILFGNFPQDADTTKEEDEQKQENKTNESAT